jgi:hypothetical protein
MTADRQRRPVAACAVLLAVAAPMRVSMPSLYEGQRGTVLPESCRGFRAAFPACGRSATPPSYT